MAHKVIVTGDNNYFYPALAWEKYKGRNWDRDSTLYLTRKNHWVVVYYPNPDPDTDKKHPVPVMLEPYSHQMSPRAALGWLIRNGHRQVPGEGMEEV